MASEPTGQTLFRPRDETRTSTARTTGLSTEVLSQAAHRLRGLALVYAVVFFLASFFARLLSEYDRARMVAHPEYWLPDTLSIALALIVAYFAHTTRAALSTVMALGLLFLVVSSYGIAIAEYIDPIRLDNNGWWGLSWVAVWTPLYVVVVPTPPRRAVWVMLAAVSSVPVVIGWMILSGRTVQRATPSEFFLGIVFPYLLVVLLGYVGARVVYDLGREVSRAHELGSYRLVERLGQGGMGEVWRAKHRLLARPAAIKVIRPSATTGRADDPLVRRFEREAQVTAELRSPHTVELWDFGIADDGGFYYVMELLDGLDLDALVKRFGAVPPERAVALVRQVCHSLAEAEDHGLVHRDIKPANIFVCRYGGEHDFVKVLDFGIVKATDTSSSSDTMLQTNETKLQGTPAFIAPEQALGQSDIDGRADIYATGCVLYWLVTGQLVFTADTVMGLLVHHAHSAPSPPSARAAFAVPPALDALVMSCLAKNPVERPQTARELARRLADISGLDVWTEERARAWWAEHHPTAAAKPSSV